MRSQPFRLATGFVAVLGSYAVSMSVAWAQADHADATAHAGAHAGPEAGRVELDHPGSGDAQVQVDLPAGLWSDFVGLGDAAVAGVVEGLMQSKARSEGIEADVKLATEHLNAIHTIISTIQGAVGEVRVRVYENPDDKSAEFASVASFYAKKLDGTEWAKIVQVQDGDEGASVFVMRRAGALRGVFVVAGDGNELILVNVLCDLSPERVKQITHTATTIGIELGGDKALREIVGEIRGRR